MPPVPLTARLRLSPSAFRFEDFDIDDDGFLGKREFLRALNLALACETGDDPDNACPSPPGDGSDAVVGGLLSDQEASELMHRLDRHRDGRVCWEAFMECFECADGLTGANSGGGGVGGPNEAWFQREGDIAEKLLQQVELQGGSTERRAWVNSLGRRFRTADGHHTGALDRSACGRVVSGPFCTGSSLMLQPLVSPDPGPRTSTSRIA